MLEKAENYLNLFRKSHNRDFGTMSSSTLLGCMIGIFSSIGESSDVMTCNVLCDSAYGAYAGLVFLFWLHVLDCYCNHPQTQTPANYKAENCFNFFRKSSYRDFGIMSSLTLLGCMIGIFRSIGESSAVMTCNALCDSAYSAYAGLAFLFGLHVLDYFCNQQQMETLPNYDDTEKDPLVSPK